jgi:hypothetical protein
MLQDLRHASTLSLSSSSILKFQSPHRVQLSSFVFVSSGSEAQLSVLSQNERTGRECTCLAVCVLAESARASL